MCQFSLQQQISAGATCFPVGERKSGIAYETGGDGAWDREVERCAVCIRIIGWLRRMRFGGIASKRHKRCTRDGENDDGKVQGTRAQNLHSKTMPTTTGDTQADEHVSSDREQAKGNEYESDATVEYPFPTCPFMPGDIVLVAARTGAGVNKPGGVGKVTTIIEEAGTATVAYLIGRKRKEKNISFEDMAQYNLGPRESRSTCKKNCE